MISIHIDKLSEKQLLERNMTIDEIESLISGFFYMDRTIVTIVSKPHLNERLTEQQTKILFLSAKGHTYKMIGEELDIEETTVKFHMKKIKCSLNVSTLGQAIKVASEFGVI